MACDGYRQLSRFRRGPKPLTPSACGALSLGLLVADAKLHLLDPARGADRAALPDAVAGDRPTGLRQLNTFDHPGDADA